MCIYICIRVLKTITYLYRLQILIELLSLTKKQPVVAILAQEAPRGDHVCGQVFGGPTMVPRCHQRNRPRAEEYSCVLCGLRQRRRSTDGR